MGAGSDYNIIRGRSLREAFHAAQEEAHHENGYGGYSGTIAEAQGYRPLASRPQGITQEEASLVAAHKAEKYGPALCAPAVNKSTLGRTSKTTLPLTLKYPKDKYQVAGEAVLKLMAAEPSKAVVGWQVVETTKKASGAVPTEARATYWTVNSVHYATAAEARAAARDLARRGQEAAFAEVKTTVFKAMGERTYAVEVERAAVTTKTKAVAGAWWAAGVYAS